MSSLYGSCSIHHPLRVLIVFSLCEKPWNTPTCNKNCCVWCWQRFFKYIISSELCHEKVIDIFFLLLLNGSVSSASPGVLQPLRQRQLLRTRGEPSVRGPLPPVPREHVPGLPAAHSGPLRHRHGGQVPPPSPSVSLLPEAAEQRLLQGAGEQALLPPLLHQTVRLRTHGSVFSPRLSHRVRKLCDSEPSSRFFCSRKEGGAGLFLGFKNIRVF